MSQRYVGQKSSTQYKNKFTEIIQEEQKGNLICCNIGNGPSCDPLCFEYFEMLCDLILLFSQKMSNPYYGYENFHWNFDNVDILLLNKFCLQKTPFRQYTNSYFVDKLWQHVFSHVKISQIGSILYSIYVMFYL